MHGWWAALLVVPYEAIGLVWTLVGLVLAVIFGASMGLSDPFENAFNAGVQYQKERTPLGWILSKSGSIVGSACLLVAWLPLIWYRRSARSTDGPYQFMRMTLQPPYVVLSFWSFILCAFVALLTGVTGSRWYLVLAAWFLIIANMGRQLLTIIPDNFDLPTALRRGIRNPVSQFGLVTGADFATLILASVVLLRWPSGSSFRWKSLWLESRDILGFSHLGGILRAHPKGAAEILVAVAGLTIYVSLLKFVRPRLFAPRNVSELSEVALCLMLLGERVSAERWMSRVHTSPNKDVRVIKVQAIWALLNRDWDTALAKARLYVQVEFSITDPVDVEADALMMLGRWVMPFVDTRDFVTTEDLFSFLVAKASSDGSLVYILSFLDESKWEILRPSVEETLRQVGITDSRYPMSLAMLALRLKRYRDVEYRLAKANPNTVNEQLIREFIRLDCTYWESSEVSRDAFLFNTLSAVFGILDTSANWPIEQFPLWMRQWLSNQIFAYEHTMRELGERRIAQELKQVRYQLIGKEDADRSEGYWKRMQLLQ